MENTLPYIYFFFFFQGYYRQGEALLKLSQYDEAIESLKVAISKEQEMENTKQISTFVTKTLIEKDNDLMGIKIIQLVSGKDIAIAKSVLNPIQSKLYEFAAHMKNIIYVVVDTESKKCIIVDAVRR